MQGDRPRHHRAGRGDQRLGGARQIDIPHTQERARLVELRQQEAAFDAEEEAALAPLLVQEAEQEAAAKKEFPKAAGPLDIQDEETWRQVAAVGEKLASIRATIRVAREQFRERSEPVTDAIRTLEAVTGRQLYDDETGKYLTCAITGLPLLDTDDVSTVLTCAVTQLRN